MKQENYTYIAIDLKSFYASVECMERGLDPLDTNLVVADESRTQKTICLAVSPSLKAWGISGRARLFEVIRKVGKVNEARLEKAPGHRFEGSSYLDSELRSCPELSLDYLVAVPRMAYYIEYSTKIYDIYLKYISPDDCHVYSIDEIFLDVTSYLGTYRLSARELAQKIVQDIYQTTGITATAGIGTNLYLCKVAMDIVAKHIPPDENGARIAELDELTYRKLLWTHRPLTDFWRVGRGYAKKLEDHGMFTMGDVAGCSIGQPEDYYNEELLYQLFGVNAQLLIDHAWGWEPCGMADIKSYQPQFHSAGSGQVLHQPYSFEKARLVVREMTDQLALDLVEKGLVTDQIVLTVGYDRDNLKDPQIRQWYQGEVTTDYYGRKVPKHAHGTARLERQTSSSRLMTEAVVALYDQIVNKNLLVRRIGVTASRVLDEKDVREKPCCEQLDLFTDYNALEERRRQEEKRLRRERKMQQAMLDIKKKFGKNAVLKGMSLEEGSTAAERNQQIGGHRAWSD